MEIKDKQYIKVQILYELVTRVPAVTDTMQKLYHKVKVLF